MCEFISWIEKDDEVLFLTGNEVFNTKRGRELQNHCKSKDDLTGHGAIRWYFGTDDKPISGGKERECTNFSTPDNFPKQIVRAIKKGQMWGFDDATPQELLTNTAWAEYEKITNPARAEYEKIMNTAWVEYEKITNTAWAEYEKIKNTARAEYEKIKNTAWAEYEKIENTAFWNIFADVNNRNPKWR